MNAVPTGLCVCCCIRQPHPTLKRGANKHCAYGAGDGILPGEERLVSACAGRLVFIGLERSGTGPFDGSPTQKPPDLPEDIYCSDQTGVWNLKKLRCVE